MKKGYYREGKKRPGLDRELEDGVSKNREETLSVAAIHGNI